MDGFKKLQMEMIEKGCQTSQINSKAVAVAYAILTDNDEFLDLIETNRRLKEENENLEKLNKRYIDELERRRLELGNLKNQILEKNAERNEYIDAFYEDLKKCESQEGRDAMKRAQVFVNSVEIDTEYDNYAFIVGLGALLSNTSFNQIKELKKIDKDAEPYDPFSQAPRRV